ncbi:response regulator transcription factor [Actibacterium lipolyticum]|uniref:Sensory transduction protein regX3 n=1 Tax=Actibacterium lipolyticum TaxID=1524263 RepID=A0A238KWH9_9RHOB|nr:response regulator transcription factor [Actibacterium lipolyticum]SMX46562.1 Sensory transduction protein regX3 [Actibacterium lipolyticum]
MAHRILIADDDPHIRDIIRIALESAGNTVVEVSNGQAALTELGRTEVDLVVLDIGMPHMDGFDCCQAIRAKSNVPILFLTARDDEIDRVLGFQLGADDFVAKPFSPRELVLRIKAILSRGKPDPARALKHGALKIESEGHLATLGGEEMALTAREFALLAYLATHAAQVHSRNQLIDALYGGNTDMSGRTLDSHIRNIRAKAAKLGCDEVIVTVHGVGVKLGGCAL